MRRVGLGFWAVVLVAALSVGGRAAAQDVKWRHDYQAARKEAAASGRPLLLDFGTESCFWCKKLDATTFRVPAVAELLNGRFVPVKIDAEKDEWLARAAAVDSYPTLVLVAADGKIVARHVGYADTAQMTALLAKAPAATPATPTPASAPPAAPPTGRAAELLALARSDHDAGRYLACLERCDELMAAHPGTPEAAEARRLAGQITGDPQKWRRVTDQIDADLAALRRNLDAAKPR
jgi:thioredoxin-related protein